MIYVDNAATTRVKPEVLEAMLPYFKDKWYNPSSSYAPSYDIAEEIEGVRAFIAKRINCQPDEIYFTSGGSEANNMAIKGVVMANQKKWKVPRIITDKIEHHSVLNAFRDLQTAGLADPVYVPVNQDGFIYFPDLEKQINKSKVKLASFMFANNEIGSTQSIEQLGKICKEHDVLFHVDAVQAFGKYRIDVQNLHIDMMSVSGHKFGAPKGIGFLYVRNGINILPLISGGQQEHGLRAGTENVPYIMGLGKAVELAYADMDENTNAEKNLKYKLWIGLQDKLEYLSVNGHMIVSAPNIINFNFSKYGIRGEEMLAFLDENGICASSGSACNSHSDEPSHVLKAIGLSNEEADCSIRFSFNEDNTEEEVDQIIKVIVQGVNLLKKEVVRQ